MRYGIISDIHGNLEALEAVLKRCTAEAIDVYYCLGDIVGYGANPKECLARIRSVNAVCVAGNHDWAVAGKLNPSYFNPVAKDAVSWTQKQLSPDEIKFLNTLGLVIKEDNAVFVHAMLSEPEYFHYMIYKSEAEENFHLMERPLCFIGHTHTPQIIRFKDNTVECLEETAIAVEPEIKYIINAGSVGQPRDGNPQAAFVIYDSQRRDIKIRRVPYNISAAQEKILRAGLPAALAHRLESGR